ncbi:uncharacterized protein LOC142983216 [Anticarsia gemmatalis]|uniref:uncharacterized protein LOC142983216 n=1 Tax=Anticarsia gemmatalis TaxID=129554 RepID=UPI003F76D45E
MDRCRCEEYAAAVKKLRFYTVGTLRPDIIDNYDRSNFVTGWIKNGISHDDKRFLKPKAWQRGLIREEPESAKRRKKIEEMWCRFMTPYKLTVYDTSDDTP